MAFLEKQEDKHATCELVEQIQWGKILEIYTDGSGKTTEIATELKVFIWKHRVFPSQRLENNRQSIVIKGIAEQKPNKSHRWFVF